MLSLVCHKDINDDVFKHFTSLKSLELLYLKNLSNTMLVCIGNYCLELQSLTINDPCKFIILNIYFSLLSFNINISFTVWANVPKSISDEGIIALANLPKLESLKLFNGFITNKAFRNFKSLKTLTCDTIENIKDGVYSLLQHCSNFQEILIFYCLNYEIHCNMVEVLQKAAEMLKQRNNVDIPLLVNSVFGVGSEGFRVRMVPIRSEKDATKKLLFQLFYGRKKVTPDFVTYDLDILIREAEFLIDKYMI